MAINPAHVAAAYAHAAKNSAEGASSSVSEVAPVAGSSFADMVKDVVNSAVTASKAAETQAVAGAGNKAEIVDVVTAVTNAELTLQTAVAVRDKVIAAYQDIMKMPI